MCPRKKRRAHTDYLVDASVPTQLGASCRAQDRADAYAYREARRLVGHRGCSTKDPTRRKRAAFAVAADLDLVDGRMERLAARFLRGLAADLGLDREAAKSILDVIRLKNSA